MMTTSLSPITSKVIIMATFGATNDHMPDNRTNVKWVMYVLLVAVCIDSIHVATWLGWEGVPERDCPFGPRVLPADGGWDHATSVPDCPDYE